MDHLTALRPTAASPAVLHVDDSAPVRHRRRRVLEAAGWQVIEADSGADARLAFAGHRPDIVLLDVRLPDVSGFVLTREIKAAAAAAQRDIAVVLISAYFTESAFRVEGLESGADAYIIEPIPDAELTATLHAVLRRLDQVRAARENERLLDALFEFIPEGITVADAPDARIRRVSRFGLALTGRARETLESLPAADQPEKWGIFKADGVTPARSEELPLTRAASAGAVITDEEWVLRRPDGRNVTVLCNAGPIRNADGEVTGAVIAWRDITARKEMERALVRHTTDLRRADQAKNEFLATVVHELRQPIQAGLAALGVMKSRADRRRGQRARDVIERQLQQIARIVEDLLDARRIVHGEVALRLEPVDLGDVLRRSLETVRPAFAEHDLHVTATIPDEPIGVQADSTRLQQVFVNLLSNAVRYTPSGGRVDVALETSPTSARVRVKDTGEGITPERLPRIFHLFSRASNQPGGFGIGLAVAKALVEAHGGAIEARSEGAGLGAEFTISLPMTS